MQIRCPHCRDSVEFIDKEPLGEMSCPSCGSSFSMLFSDETATMDYHGSHSIGHFELIEQVGVGQFGSVWRAHDTELDRTVALKIPRKEQLDPSEAELFLREARTAAQLRHPGIVSVHEVGRDNETIYIASDFIDGANLSEWLTAQRLNSREAAALLIEIAQAVHHAHEAGVVHRDLKPSNIMIDRDGCPHIADFGLAKREMPGVTMTLEGRILGTPAYMSPEQARGEAHLADRRCDIYSLGVILFELLTDELPFRGEARMLIVQIVDNQPPSPCSLNPRVPRDLETICLKCLEKEPKRRYQSAQELAVELTKQLAGEPISARPIGRAQRAWRWCQRKPAVALLSLGIFIAIVSGITSSTYYAIKANDRAIEAGKNAQRAREETVRADRNAEEAKRLANEYLVAKNRAEKNANKVEKLANQIVMLNRQKELFQKLFRNYLEKQAEFSERYPGITNTFNKIKSIEKNAEPLTVLLPSDMQPYANVFQIAKNSLLKASYRDALPTLSAIASRMKKGPNNPEALKFASPRQPDQIEADAPQSPDEKEKRDYPRPPEP